MSVDEIATWLSPKDAARILDVNPDWIAQMLDDGRLRGVKTRIGRLLDPRSVAEEAERRASKKREGEKLSA